MSDEELGISQSPFLSGEPSESINCALLPTISKSGLTEKTSSIFST